jgi:chromosome partitioning protein
MSHDIYQEINSRYGEELCKARISENVSVAESPASNEDVFAHAPESRGAQDYDALLDELIETGFLP